MSEALIKKIRAQRMSWVALDDGKRVQIIRPTEIELANQFVKNGSIEVDFEEVKRFVVGWEGITEADLLGAAVGASDPIGFTTELWAEFVADNIKWVRTIARAMLDDIVKHHSAQDDAVKN